MLVYPLQIFFWTLMVDCGFLWVVGGGGGGVSRFVVVLVQKERERKNK